MQESKTDTAWVDPTDWIDPESPEQPALVQLPIHSTDQPFELAKVEEDPNAQAEFLAFLSELETDSARADAAQGSSAEPQPDLAPDDSPQERPPDQALQDQALEDLSDPLKDAYQLLELPPWASLPQIKAAYREQMQQSHPDRLPASTPLILRASAEREFEHLQASYRLLLSHHTQASGSKSTADPVAQPKPPASGVPIPPEPASMLDQIPSWLRDPRWWILGAGLMALGVGIPLVANRPATVSQAPDPEPVLPVSVSTPVVVEDLDPVPTPAERIRLGQIDRFAQILQALQPLQAQADSQLAQASTQAQRDAIEADFDRTARPIIESYGLTVADYLLIARRSQQDPDLARQIADAAQRLQRRDPAR